MKDGTVTINRFSGSKKPSSSDQQFLPTIIENTIKRFSDPPTKGIRAFIEKVNKFSAEDLKKMQINAKLELSGVVYIVLHIPSMTSYVGETGNPLKKRISEHYYGRFSGGSGLSDRFLLDDDPSHYLFTPLYIEHESEARKKKETAYISIFQPSMNVKKIYASNMRPANHRLHQRLRKSKLLSHKDLEDLLCRLPTDKPKEKLEEKIFLFTYSHPALTVPVVRKTLLNHKKEISKDPIFLSARQRYTTTLGGLLFNFSDFAKDSNDELSSKRQRTETSQCDNSSCLCSSLPSCCNQVFGNHICGFAKDIFSTSEFKDKFKNSERLALLCEGGASLRLSLPTKTVKKTLFKELEKFTDYNKDLTNTLFQELSEKIDTYNKTRDHVLAPLSDDEESCISELQKHFIFTVVDKAANTIALTCKHYYHDCLRRTLQPYQILTQDEKQQKLSIVQTEGVIPYGYIIPKFHKNKEAFRLIVGSPKSGNYLSDISRKFSALLNGVLYTLACENEEHVQKKGYPHFFVVRDLSITPKEIGEKSISGTNLITTDFSSMYQNLSKTKILDAVSSSIGFCFEYIANKLAVSREQIRIGFNKFDREVYYSTEKTNDNYCYDELLQFLQTIIYSSMFEFQGTFYEESGLTTGGECSGELANIALADIERKKIDQRGENETQRQALKDLFTSKTAFFFRYVDDALLTENMKPFLPTEFDYGLSYSDSQCGTSVHWGGFLIRTTPFSITVFNKQLVLPFVMTRFPLFSSLLPRHIFKGCVTGAMKRLRYICTDFELFLYAVEDVLKIFISRGYTSQLLIDACKSFCPLLETKEQVRLTKLFTAASKHANPSAHPFERVNPKSLCYLNQAFNLLFLITKEIPSLITLFGYAFEGKLMQLINRDDESGKIELCKSLGLDPTIQQDFMDTCELLFDKITSSVTPAQKQTILDALFWELSDDAKCKRCKKVVTKTYHSLFYHKKPHHCSHMCDCSFVSEAEDSIEGFACSCGSNSASCTTKVKKRPNHALIWFERGCANGSKKQFKVFVTDVATEQGTFSPIFILDHWGKNTSSGHFTSKILFNQHWWQCNDQKVHQSRFRINSIAPDAVCVFFKHIRNKPQIESQSLRLSLPGKRTLLGSGCSDLCPSPSCVYYQKQKKQQGDSNRVWDGMQGALKCLSPGSRLFTQPRDLRVNPISSTKLEHNCSTQNPTSTSETFQTLTNENGPFFF